jgi:predicted P-loop ATPase
MQVLPASLAALGHYRQFIVYKLVPRTGQLGKMDKLPIRSRDRSVADAHDPGIWLSAADAIAIATAWGHPYGVGFVFTAADPFWFLDIDGCLLDNPPRWSPLANELIAALPGAAVEVSQSGRGLHIIGTGTPPAHRCKVADLGLEFYHEGRFVALTGTHASGDAGTDLTAALPMLVDRYFSPDSDGDTARPADWTTGPLPEWDGPTDDNDLIAKACTTRNNTAAAAFGGRVKATFLDLFMADPLALGKAWPDRFGSRPYDASSADAALASHLAFWTGCDCERIERIMRMSALARDKWDKHRSYMHRTITGAVSRCDQVYKVKKAPAAPTPPAMPVAPVEPLPQGMNDPLFGLAFPPGGKLNTTLEAAVMIAGHIRVAFDEFKQRVVLLSPPPWNPNDSTTPRNWTDADTIETQAWLQGQLMKPSKDATADAVVMIANRNQNHPVKNYLDRLEWDGVSRLDNWMVRYLGASINDYTQAIGSKFMIAAVARIYSPGCKADNMLILEGEQGLMKSTAVAELMPTAEWFTDELPDVSNKDAAMQLHGAWIIEVAEMDAMGKAESSAVKKFITRRVDRYRPPFGRAVVDIPRQSLFIGTINPGGHGYLKDQTGNRRFWPVTCTTCDVESLRQDRDQLWAEAVTRYRAGEKWWMTADQERQLTQPEQEARRETDPWEDIIKDRLEVTKIGAITTNRIAIDILKIPADRLNVSHSKKIASILRSMGWVCPEKKHRIAGSRNPERVFYRDPDEARLHGGLVADVFGDG